MEIKKVTIKYALALIIFLEICKEYIPNVISAMRVPAIAVFTYTIMHGHHWSGLFLAILIAITDWADGWLARKWEVASTFGAHLDAYVDKLILIPMWVMITECDYVIDELHYLLYLMLVREVWIIGMRWKRGRKSKSLDSAKWKASLQFAVIIIYPLMHLNSGVIFFLLLCCLYLCFLVATYLSIHSVWKYTFRPVWV